MIVGVLNVTPDSFSDGGRFLDRADAIGHGVRLREQGADLVDVGGESTRPGAERVDEAEERRRVLPVITELVSAGVPVSIDTTRADVAAAAVEAGASLVNDVSGGLADKRMAAVVADLDVPWVLMHWRAHSREMAAFAEYADVVADVRRELTERIEAALAAGVAESRIVVDPGLGFAKRPEHDWALLANLDAIIGLGRPVLVGASRKSFIGRLLADPDGSPRPPDGREDATAAITALAAQAGAWGVRVHAVPPSRDAALVVAAWQAAAGGAR